MLAIPASFYILYLIIKAGVHDGIIAARQRQEQADNPPQDHISQINCPTCGYLHDIDYPKCPSCGHRY